MRPCSALPFTQLAFHQRGDVIEIPIVCPFFRRTPYAVLFVLLFCTTGLSVAAESPLRSDPTDTSSTRDYGLQQRRTVEVNSVYFKGYWDDTKSIVTAPANWDPAAWEKASVLLAVSAGLFTQDDWIKTRIQRNRTSTATHVADDAATIYTYSIPALAGLGVYGYLASDRKAESTFLLGAESALITAVFVQTLKRSTGRHRPYTGDSHDTWSGPTLSGHNERLSFPSGDASTAFAMASVVASEYENPFVSLLVYGASSLVALERVYKNAHWSSDVFVGSVIGYYTGKAVADSHANGRQNQVLLAPQILDGGIGVTARCRF
jgi:membrane-associated phospholipid phosphatase